MDKRNPEPIEGHAKVYSVTGDDGNKYLVRVENGIDNDRAKLYLSQNIKLTKQRILTMLKSENDIPNMKAGILRELESAQKLNSEWSGNADDNQIEQLNELINTAKNSLETIEIETSLLVVSKMLSI